MITVAGEALLDIVVDPAGALAAHPGGAALNVARTIARLGGDCRFLGRLSGDRLGARLRAAAVEDGVTLVAPEPVSEPTTLALAELDERGVAEYAFYLQGTSAAQLAPRDVPAGLPGETGTLVLGGLALLMEPIASTLAGLVTKLPSDSLVVLDPNCRAGAAADPAAHRRLIDGLSERADVVKVSTGDLAMLAPGTDPRRAAHRLLDRGARVVLVTNGAAPVEVMWRDRWLQVPVPRVPVRDTVAAGDALVGAFTLWWAGRSLGREQLGSEELLARAVAGAVEIAALTCTRPGAEPPRIPNWQLSPAVASGLIAAAG